MNDQHLESVLRNADVAMMRAEQRIVELQEEVDRLTDENAKLTKKLSKARNTIRRMEEGEL
jgi:predicted  nucleic acid-binding Zn-ribbon protein